ncbi:hypothetical protein TRFO_15529 [Tritrichomonas foetus]|uniref:Uncharacterized protein n=1 Tax=Tritrichomonas foetus TaxID=1144522 RepID=A0A1J4KTK2_9EUKA|nr:hypothetical protein TRFO_15529 [Tritrichomonas foetus]|eukprot:OHT14224.1 hypothetical protein TRFO_15529 [Tritrichomonas foetus]
MTSELKYPPVICVLNSPNDATLKQFMTSSKNVFPQRHIICSMKAAIDLAVKGKPPVIKPPQQDMMNLPGNQVSLVVTNWISQQLKKPPQKAPAKKPPPKKGGKNAPQQSVDSTPRAPEPPENFGPHFIYITEYPKTIEQMKDLCSSASPAICFINLEGPTTETSRKGNQSAKDAPTIDWKAHFASDLPFLSVNLMNVPNPDEICANLLNNVISIYNGFNAYRKEFLDYRFVSIPKYPPSKISLPQTAQDKPPAKVVQPSASKITQQVPVEPPPIQLDLEVCLKAAYKKTLLMQIDQYMKRSKSPTFSPNFQHSAELLPSYPLPATLALILSHTADPRAQELFTMRSLAYRTGMSFNTILDFLIIHKFEEIVGYSVGERRHIEQIPLDFVPNVISPLISSYSSYKSCEFAGKILLAFFHKIPESLPIMENEESYKLPLVKGFGKWIDDKINEFPPKFEEEELQTSIAVNTGGKDLYLGFTENLTKSTKTSYFDESGLRVDTIPPVIENGLVTALNFNVQYCNNPKFAFKISQKPLVTKDEEEEDDAVDTSVVIRGVLGNGLECLLDYSSEKSTMLLMTKNSTIEFDITNGRTIVTGVRDEVKRVITFNGDVIKYTPEPIIYKNDGSIQTFHKGDWHLVDNNGHAFVKKDGKWYKDPENDQTFEVADTYFTQRKVTNFSNGVSYIEDGELLTIAFPDGTKHAQNDGLFTHPDLPGIKVQDGLVSVETNDFIASFSENKDCSIDMRNNSCSFSFKESSSHVLIQYGQFKNVLTMADLYTGIVAHVGSRRNVYYLNDEFCWKIGKQTCSKKEILQHFQDNDFVERLTPVEEAVSELEPIISNGHKPRLFVIEKEQNSLSVKELLAESDFQNIMEQSTTRISKKEDSNVTLWFDTEPKSYKEIVITPKLTPPQKEAIIKGMEEQRDIEEKRNAILSSVSDPAWRNLEIQQKKEEDEMQELLRKYNVQMNGEA